MSLHLIDEVLGRDVCEALLGFHALTGCDQTGNFYRHSKLNCWQTFVSSPSDVIMTFQNLGVEELTSDICDGFVLQRKAKHDQQPFWTEMVFIFEISNRADTASSYNESIRASYPGGTFHHFSMEVITHCLTKSSWSMWLCDFGWKSDDVYQPILTTNLPAPESILELSSCKCKIGRNSGRCRCHKNSLVCVKIL